MKFGKISATVFMAVAAVGITAGTAGAAPAQAQPAVSQQHQVSGTDHGIGYHAALSDNGKDIAATVDSGKFEVVNDGAAVALKSDTGATVAQVPLTFNVSGHSIPVSEQISADSQSLTLTPHATADDISELKNINSFTNLMTQIHNNMAGVVIGGMLGGMLGGILGLGIFSIITGPVGGLVGAMVGGAAQGGQPFIDAVKAFATGQP